MFSAHEKLYYGLLAAPLVLTMSSCGGGSDGKWLEAPNALNMAQLGERAKAISSHAPVGDTSCKAMLPRIEEAVGTAEPSNFLFQGAIQPCQRAGLEFGERLRCKNGRLQVMCR